MSLNPFPSIKRGVLAFLGWLHAAVCALMTEEGRKAWALVIAWGCGISMTAYAVAVLWFVRRSPMLAFWLGLSAMGIILVVITGIMVLLGVRRNIHGKFRDAEIGLDDFDPNGRATATVTATVTAPASAAPAVPPQGPPPAA